MTPGQFRFSQLGSGVGLQHELKSRAVDDPGCTGHSECSEWRSNDAGLKSDRKLVDMSSGVENPL